MIKILRESNAPKYIRPCPKCQCIFEFTENDWSVDSERLGYDSWEDSYYIKCPDCGERVFLAHTKKEIKKIILG